MTCSGVFLSPFRDTEGAIKIPFHLIPLLFIDLVPHTSRRDSWKIAVNGWVNKIELTLETVVRPEIQANWLQQLMVTVTSKLPYPENYKRNMVSILFSLSKLKDLLIEMYFLQWLNEIKECIKWTLI